MPSEPALHPVPPTPRLLEVFEVAHELKCSHETVLRFIRKRQLTAVRLTARSWRVRRLDLDAFIEQRIAHEERALDTHLGQERSQPRAVGR